MCTVQEVRHREELKTKNNDLQVTYWSYSYLSGSKSQTLTRWTRRPQTDNDIHFANGCLTELTLVILAQELNSLL